MKEEKKEGKGGRGEAGREGGGRSRCWVTPLARTTLAASAGGWRAVLGTWSWKPVRFQHRKERTDGCCSVPSEDAVSAPSSPWAACPDLAAGAGIWTSLVEKDKHSTDASDMVRWLAPWICSALKINHNPGRTGRRGKEPPVCPGCAGSTAGAGEGGAAGVLVSERGMFLSSRAQCSRAGGWEPEPLCPSLLRDLRQLLSTQSFNFPTCAQECDG